MLERASVPQLLNDSEVVPGGLKWRYVVQEMLGRVISITTVGVMTQN